MRSSSLLLLAVVPLLLLDGAACSSTTDTASTPPSTSSDSGSPDDDGGTPPDQDGGTPTDSDGGNTDAGVDAAPFVQAPHRAFPQIPGGSKNVLTPMRLVSILTPAEIYVAELTSFGDGLNATNWWKSFAGDYGLTTVTHLVITGPTFSSTAPTQQTMDQYIGQAISSHPEAADDGHTLYLLYLPPGVNDYGNSGCSKHGGYHTVGTAGRVWGVAERCPTCAQQPNNPYCVHASPLQSLTEIASHEIAEAATDPSLDAWTLDKLQSTQSSPWSSTEGEVGDMCLGTIGNEGSWTYQRVWSNSAAAAGGDPCVPALKAPYYNVSVPQDWYAIPAGGSVDIPMTGWSTAAMNNWLVGAGQITGNGTFDAAVTSSTTISAGGTKYPTINNGGSATLSVTAPAQSGAFAVIWISSVELSPAQSTDSFHFWPVGVYTQ